MKKVFVWFLFALAASGCGGGEQKKSGPAVEPSVGAKEEAAHLPENVLRIEPVMLRDLRITTTAVEVRAGNENASLVGELRVNEDAYAEVGTPIAGKVSEIRVGLGQRVAQGQTLAILQSTELGKVRGEYVTARARFELAQTTLERKRKLAEQKIAPLREVQEAEAAVKSAEADVRAIQASLRALGSSADDLSEGAQLEICSPLEGTVIDREAIQGQMTDPSKPLFKIANLARLWLTAHAFERDAVRVSAGSVARITFAALPGQTFNGKVTLVGKQVDTDSRTVAVRIEVANHQNILRPGMSATAFVPLGGSAAKILAVPTAAVQRIQEQWYVFLPRSADTFELRPIGRGRDLGGEVEILSGVKAGETVVVDGAFLLKAEADKARGEGEHDEH
jgi:membrane fusion protein, heavy metal efflux system